MESRIGFIAAFSLILGFAALPILFAIPAVFMDSTSLSDGVDVFATEAMSFANVVEKFEYLSANQDLLSALIRTLVVALGVGIVSSCSAMALAFASTRLYLGWAGWLRPLGYFAYLTPPIVLVLSIGWLSQFAAGQISALLVVSIGQAAFLFPLNYGLAVGHWMQSEWAVDRNASLDGARFWRRFFVHFAPGTSSFAFCGGLALLTFMLAWSDVVFSRFLLMNDRDNRLLTDLVIDFLSQSDVTEPRGELAVVAFLTVFVAAVASGAYALVFARTARRV